MKGVILSGGHGTRLRPLTHTGPKQLIPIANKPVIEYAIEDLRDAGITDIGIILGTNMPNKIKDALGDGTKFGVNITYIMQGEPKGLAHAVATAKDFVDGDSFVMYLGDNILKSGIEEFVEGFDESEFSSRLLLQEVEDPRQFGVAELNDEGKIIHLVEKPKHPKNNLALVGIYLFKNNIFDAINKIEPSWRNELEITDAIQRLIDDGFDVDSFVVEGWWKDTGKPEDVLDANQLILETIEKDISSGATIEENVKIKGRVIIGENTVVKSGSVIKGPAIIGNNCEIKGYVGPYTSIGNNTKIIESEIDSSIIIGESVIQSDKRITDSLLGQNSKIISDKVTYPKGRSFVIGENSIVKL
ncbi:glucose-1-phosphate thymidylyltransferase [Methanosphaera stadtmanae]|uniref:glucose-1-phosphate thymidylyltransferase n=1 Tax=Methanosphaera stadtmanae TaxID=2317 RepID=UPI002674B87C|nr:glucose-1-phosphate thymidylyltransferase [Methanosphaera stadtmanae]